MTGNQHLFNGICVGLGTFYYTQDFLLSGAVVVGSLLPDIDYPDSKIGRLCRVISKPMYEYCGHRTVTHNLFFALAFILIHFAVVKSPLWIGLFWGIIAHLILDSTTRGGVMWFYPSRRKIALTSTKASHPLCWVYTFVWTVAFLYLINKYFSGWNIVVCDKMREVGKTFAKLV